MSDTLSPILQWLNTHPQLAGIATFGISAMESVAIIGTIVPGTVMMTAIGTLVGVGIISLWPTLFWAILGAIVGDGISYWLGRRFNNRLPAIWPFRTHPGLLENGENFFRKYGGMSVFIGRFVGPVRALVPLVAGMLDMSPLRFTLANILSAIAWAPAYMLPGILLGTVSLELPPDIAVHVIMMLLAIILFIMLCIWVAHRLFTLINKQIDQMLTWIWGKLYGSSYFYFITSTLKHHTPKKAYGQLILAFYFLAMSCVLLSLALYIQWNGSADITINQIFFHLFRGLRTPGWDNFMLSITLLGELKVILPVIITLFAWLAYTQRWHTAWHVLALGILSAGGVEILKLVAHSPRPWGLLHSPSRFSFPSGHTTLTVALYSGIFFLLLQALQVQSRRIVYYVVLPLILLVSVSRLYLGVHWFTDVLGGWLLGSAAFMLVSISYNRQHEKTLRPTGIIFTILLTLIISYSFYAYYNFDRLKQNSTQLDWPTHTLSAKTWWYQQGEDLPLYRINRFGLSSQILNLQWIGNLSNIKHILLKNGWEIPPKKDLVSILHRISNVNSTEHLPLLAPLYLDKTPVLVLIKHINGDKKLIVLRFWQSNVILQDSKLPLWVGSVEIAPSTYSWLFKPKQQVTLKPGVIFRQALANYELRETTVQLKHTYHPRTQPLILIKPKN